MKTCLLNNELVFFYEFIPGEYCKYVSMNGAGLIVTDNSFESIDKEVERAFLWELAAEGKIDYDIISTLAYVNDELCHKALAFKHVIVGNVLYAPLHILQKWIEKAEITAKMIKQDNMYAFLENKVGDYLAGELLEKDNGFFKSVWFEGTYFYNFPEDFFETSEFVEFMYENHKHFAKLLLDEKFLNRVKSLVISEQF